MSNAIKVVYAIDPRVFGENVLKSLRFSAIIRETKVVARSRGFVHGQGGITQRVKGGLIWSISTGLNFFKVAIISTALF